MTSSPNMRPEAGFTLVEMIIALAIFGILMAAALPAIGNMLDLGNRGAANAQASSDASYALQTAEADLRRARANRGAGAFDDGPSVASALSSANQNMHDIVAASPTRLQLWTDAIGSLPGSELVTYELRLQTARSASGPCDRTAKTSWCVIRTIRPASGGTSIVEVLTHGTGTFPLDSACIPGNNTPVRRLFCYQHKVPAVAGNLAARYTWAAWRPTCAASWGTPPAGAGSWNTTNVNLTAPVNTFHDRIRSARTSIRSLDTITAIGIVLPAGGRTDGARGLATSVTTVELRNRSTEEYLTAIMCGAR